MFVNIDIDSA